MPSIVRQVTPLSTAGPPCSHSKMWLVDSMSVSSPGRQCSRTAIWFDIVPDGTKTAASLPKSWATRSSSRLTVGSSPYTSSPTGAASMAASIAGVGFVTVSDRRSMSGVMRSG